MKITDALVAEHSIYLKVFDEIDRVLPSLTTAAQVQVMGRMVERLLEPHAADESTLAYAALDHVLAHRGQLDRMHHEHRELDMQLHEVQEAATCEDARRLLTNAIAASRAHFKLEEEALFPILEKTLKPETLSVLGRAWLERRTEAPATTQ